MNYGMEVNQICNTSEYLVALALFKRTERLWESLTPEAIRESFLDTPPPV